MQPQPIGEQTKRWHDDDARDEHQRGGDDDEAHGVPPAYNAGRPHRGKRRGRGSGFCVAAAKRSRVLHGTIEEDFEANVGKESGLKQMRERLECDGCRRAAGL